jgi:hypothetical protein
MTKEPSCAMAATCPLHHHQQGTQDNVQQCSKTAWNDISGGLKSCKSNNLNGSVDGVLWAQNQKEFFL